MMKLQTFQGELYVKSFKYDWLSLSIQVGLIPMYAITNIVYKECNFITDKIRYNDNIRMPKEVVNQMVRQNVNNFVNKRT